MRQHFPLSPATGLEDQSLMPWLDGDPAAGIEGSYPGHALMTDCEAEILNAIIAAGITPDGNDLTQLAQALGLARIITTPITKTVGGSGADFANLQAAFSWLSGYRITQTGSVTFQIAAGQFVYNTSISFNHPDGARVFVVGATLKKAQPAASSLAYTGNSASARQTDTTNNLATLRGVYATEIVLQGGAVFTGTGALGNVQDILFTGDNTSGADGILWSVGFLALTRTAVVGAGQRGVCAAAAFISTTGTCYALGNGTVGWSIENASVLSTKGGSIIVGSSNGARGVYALFSRVASSGGSGGAALYTRGNGTGGVMATGGAIVADSTSISRDNVSFGFYVESTGSISADGSQSINNNFGYTATLTASMSAQNTSGANTTYAYYAINGASLLRTGGTATGGTATASPAVGSVGNSNAYIS